MKMKCQHCGREYIVFNSTAIVKGAFCCLHVNWLGNKVVRVILDNECS